MIELNSTGILLSFGAVITVSLFCFYLIYKERKNKKQGYNK